MAKPKLRKASEHAAYLIADVTAEEAAKHGLQVVENDAFGKPTAYGTYESTDTEE